MKWGLVSWTVVVIAFVLVLTVVVPSKGEVCERRRGVWDEEIELCFYRGN